ncbi:hypothetical protein J4Q44_G00012620 [Coregonus suidteri]|uniref:Uncharacterized protein n=1 Tax=Coregonus suidteri TaxID=861788 RepID=A0AAN8RAX1_9TELE
MKRYALTKSLIIDFEMQCFKMIALADAVFFAILSSYTVGSVGNASSVEFKIRTFEDQPLVMQLAAVYKEMEHLKCEQKIFGNSGRP